MDPDGNKKKTIGPDSTRYRYFNGYDIHVVTNLQRRSVGTWKLPISDVHRTATVKVSRVHVDT